MSKTQKVYRTAIYARLSKEDGDKAESNSIASQKALCGEYIAKHEDLELVDTIVDDGHSGVSMDRPGFRKLEKALKDGRIEAVVCKDMSRLTRNYLDGGKYLERIFPQLGVRFIAINDNYDSLNRDPHSDSYIIPFKNLINDTYCRDISVKIRSNLEVKRRKGEYVGSYAPYGYRKDRDDHNKLSVDEEAAEVVRRIFSRFKDGAGIGKIADELNSMGIASPMEHKIASGIHFKTAFRRNETAKWTYQAVKRILTNEAYIGILSQGKRGTPNYKVHEIQKKDEEEWVTVEGALDPIVSHEDFMAVRTMLGRDCRSAAEGEQNLFSGFLFCADCGQPMIRKMVPSKKKKYHYFVCSSNRRHEGCSSHSISEGKLSEAVENAVKVQVGQVLDLSETLDYLDRLPAADRRRFNYESQMEKLEEEMEKCRKMKLRLYEDLSDGVINKKEYADFRNRYESMLEEKEDALERVRREMKETSLGRAGERAWTAVFKQFGNIDSLSRRALMSLVDRVRIFENGALEVVFRYGDELEMAMAEVKEHSEELRKMA